MVLRSPPRPSKWVANECLSACGVAVSGNPSAPRICSTESWMIRGERTASRPDKQRSSRFQIVRTQLQVGLDQIPDGFDHGRGSCFPAFAFTTTTSRRPVGASERLSPIASEIRSPAPYSSASTAASRAMIQGQPCFARPSFGIGEIAGVGHRQSLRQGTRRLRGRIAENAPIEANPRAPGSGKVIEPLPDRAGELICHPRNDGGPESARTSAADKPSKSLISIREPVPSARTSNSWRTSRA